MRLDKLIDVSIGHPFGDNRKVAVAHCHSQQRENIRMTEVFPHHNLFAEPLRNRGQLLTAYFRQTSVGDPP